MAIGGTLAENLGKYCPRNHTKLITPDQFEYVWPCRCPSIIAVCFCRCIHRLNQSPQSYFDEWIHFIDGRRILRF